MQERDGRVVKNPVLLLLLTVALASALGLGFVGFAPNRILSPRSLALWGAADPLLLGAILVGFGIALASTFGWPRRGHDVAAFLGGSMILVATVLAAGEVATALVTTAKSSAARVSLGGAFWVMALTSSLAMAEALRRAGIERPGRIGVAAVFVAGFAALAYLGWYDDLSIAREWANRRAQYSVAFGEHVRLVATALVVSLLIGVPLGALTTQRPRFAGRVFTVLNLVQTIPSIALFGLLIGPLTALSNAVPGLAAAGVRGIGFTPALIALVLYSLLPIARNTQVGLLGVPPRVIDAALGMGMTGFQIVTRVSIPLALPVLLAGLRIVTVQLIGLAVVAALIGAGGFGGFVFLGLGQTATDLVLLGALSAIAFALVADAGLRLLTVLVARVEGQ